MDPVASRRRSRALAARLIHALLLSALAVTSLAARADLSATLAPSGNFDFSHWKLTEPVDANGGTSGEAVEVASSTLVAGHRSSWFDTAADGGLVFWAPVDGATTQGSSYPRSELRELLNAGNDRSNWTCAGNSVLDARLRVNAVPSSSGKLVIGQIHGYDSAPLVKLRYQYSPTGGGRIDALVHRTPFDTGDLAYPLASGIALDQMFYYRLVVSHGLLSMSVNGATPVTHAIDASWSAIGLYFKAGAYVQASGSSATDGGRATFYRIAASHPDNGLAVTTSALPGALAGTVYVQALTAKGGSGGLLWSLVSGRLPDGLSLDRGSGVISGLLPLNAKPNREPSFTVLASDGAGASAAKTLTIKITPLP